MSSRKRGARRWMNALSSAVIASFVLTLSLHARAADYDVIVVGAGPGGNAAVGAALRNGAKNVLLVEQRSLDDRTRGQTLTLEPTTLEVLRGAGVDTNDASKFTKLRNVQFSAVRDGKASPLLNQRISYDTDHVQPAGPGHVSPVAMITGRQAVMTAPIKALEEAQQDSFRNDPRATRVDHSQVENVTTEGDGARVFMKDKDGVAVEHRAKLVGVAVGTRNPLIAKLGVETHTVATPVSSIVQGVFAAPRQDLLGVTARVSDLPLHEGDLPAGADRSALVRVMLIGSDHGTTVGGEVPPGPELSEPQKQAYVRAMAKFVGNISSEPSTLTSYTPTLNRASKVFASKRVVLLGDAYATTVPQVGLGANFAVAAGHNFGNLFHELSAAHDEKAGAKVTKQFEEQTERATNAYHAYSNFFPHAAMPTDEKGDKQGLKVVSRAGSSARKFFRKQSSTKVANTSGESSSPNQPVHFTQGTDKRMLTRNVVRALPRALSGYARSSDVANHRGK